MTRLFISVFLISVSHLAICFQNTDLMSLVEKSVELRAESKYDSALYFMYQVVSEAKKSNDYEFLARAYIEISSTLLDTNRDSLATFATKDALKFSKLSDFKGLEMTAVYNWGKLKEREGKLDSAMYFYKQAESHNREVNDDQKLSVVLSGIASIYTKTGNNLQAIEISRESAGLYLQTGQYEYLARRYWSIGEDYLILAQGDKQKTTPYYLDSAEFYYDQSRHWSDSLSFPVPHYMSLRGLAVASEMRGLYKEALNYMYRSNNITQQLYSANIENKLLEVREKYNTANLEIKALQKERERNTVLIVAFAIVVAISIWLYVVDQRRKNIKAISEKNDQINKQKIDELLQEQEIASLQGVLEGQETERKRVAIDLHDRLGGILSMVKLHFSSVEEKIDPDNPSKEKFLTASELLDLAAGEVRNISHNMMSGVLAKFGLIPALEDLQSRISETGKLTVNLYTSNVNGALDGEQELQLYRIVQELMSNILKHSDATETNIQLNENEGSVNLIVEDDGIGFNPQKLDVKAGIGLNNLKARVAKLNGTLHIDSGLGAGTTVSIDIPVEND